MKQMKNYLKKRLNASNSKRILEEAIIYDIEELVEEAAYEYFQSCHVPSENAEDCENYTSMNLHFSET